MKIFHVKENLDKEDERNTTVPDIQNRAFHQDQVKKGIIKKLCNHALYLLLVPTFNNMLCFEYACALLIFKTS